MKFLIDAFNAKAPSESIDFDAFRDPKMQESFEKPFLDKKQTLIESMSLGNLDSVSLSQRASADLVSLKNKSGASTDASSFNLPNLGISTMGVNQVQVAPVSVETSSVNNVNNVIRQMGRGDFFTNNALSNLGAAAV